MHSRTIALAAAATAFAFSLAGCAAGNAGFSPQPPGNAAASLPEAPGALSPAAKSCKEKLYVSSYKLDYVAIYCTKGHNQAPLGKITDGIDGPEGANVNAKGNLYVTNTNGNTVTEYDPGSVDPSYTYSSGLGYPAGVAVDSKQNVYITCLSPPSLEVFAQKTNSAKLKITNLTYPIDVALDKSGNAYVTSYNPNFAGGEIVEYSSGSTEGTSLGITTKAPGGIALDKHSDIVTADQSLPGVLIFPPGKTVASKTFGQNALDPDPVRLSRSERTVYVGDSVGNAVYVYDYPSGKLIDTITDGIDGPNGLALDPAAPL